MVQCRQEGVRRLRVLHQTARRIALSHVGFAPCWPQPRRRLAVLERFLWLAETEPDSGTVGMVAS